MEEMIREDVVRAAGDAVYFMNKTNAEFYSNPMLWHSSEPVILPPLECPL